MHSRRGFIGAVLSSFAALFRLPSVNWFKQSYFSTMTFIKVPTKVFPTVSPNIMMGESETRLKIMKARFEDKSYLLHTSIISVGSQEFAVRSRWKSKAAYIAWLKCIKSDSFMKDLSKNNIHWSGEIL